MKRRLVAAAWLALASFSFVSSGWGGNSGAATALPEVVRSNTAPADVVLITLDTTRADHLDAATLPTVWKLASTGTRYSNAWSPSPLTLPAHASLLTGLLPPRHGLRVNGIGLLSPDVPTLAETLSAQGYATGAVVASLVLDRRFGLSRGFDRYDDAMDARRKGEYGYAERSANEVVDGALRLWRELEEGPRFLWVHFYDAHRPYTPSGEQGSACGSVADCYRLELVGVDREIARLLMGLDRRTEEQDAQPDSVDRRSRLVVVVGDHGESLGEHGEETHGVFLYGSTLRVPLVVSVQGGSGRGVSGKSTVSTKVDARLISTHEVPSLIYQALGLEIQSTRATRPTRSTRGTEKPVFAEALMPRDTFGWAPLRSLTEGSWRYIERDLENSSQELFDLSTDSREDRNLFAERPKVAKRMAESLDRLAKTFPNEVGFTTISQPSDATSVAEHAQLRSRLGALGYVVGSTRAEHDGIDPIDGMALQREAEQAQKVLAGEPSAEERQAVLRTLRSVARRNPNNVPLLGQLSSAQLAAGEPRAALVSIRRAIELAPDLDFSHLRLASLLESLGRKTEALSAYRRVLELDPRSYSATLALAQEAARADQSDREAAILESSIGAGLVSPLLELRLARILIQRGHGARARVALQRLATRSPDSPEARIALALLETDLPSSQKDPNR